MLWINNVVFHSPGFETHKELVALLHINVNTVLQKKLSNNLGCLKTQTLSV
jgi:hypothetical protein